ncbi:MAG: MBL fold metallo-hydrolase [Gemmatimonadales bacterium]
MILTRFYDEKLAQASYLVGCGRTGEALVVDPTRQVEQYIGRADQDGLKITAVTETHIHADFVSGARELADRSGARLYLSDAGEEPWKYTYAKSAGATLLQHGSRFSVGNIQLEVVHTPGHTPEHLSFLVTDTAGATSPMGLFTGDFVFVGDVGRPDLLEKAARVTGASELSARNLFRSLQQFRRLPDHLQLWPGHGAGSACGKGLSAVPQSTVGYEKLFNWALGIAEEDEFVRQVLAGQPEPPKYFAEMKRINQLGPPVLGGFRRPVRLPEGRLRRLLEDGALVVDTRAAVAFGAGHIPGTISLTLNKAFPGWAGWLLPYDRDFYLIVDDNAPTAIDEAVRDLALIGLDRIGGFFGGEIIDTWAATEGALEVVPQITVAELAERSSVGGLTVVDVRNATEWEEGHLPGARHIPLGYVLDSLDQIPRDRPVVVHCQTGARSAIAVGLLQARGWRNAINFGAGFAGWQADGLPVERG